MRFELVLALRYLREGHAQTALILAGTTVGVAVIIFITAIVNGLQASLATRTLSTQAHITVKNPDEAPNLVFDRLKLSVAARIEPRVQRVKSIDQWEAVVRGLPAEPHVTAVSPMVAGAGFASRGAASRSIAIIGVDPEPYQRIVDVPDKMLSGRFQVAPGEAVIGTELARDLGAGVGDRIQVVSTEGRRDVFRVNGTFDLGVRDLNKRWVIVPLRSAQTLMDLPGGVTNIDLKVDDIFAAEEVARHITERTGLLAESWMAVNTQLLTAFKNQTMVTRTVRLFLILIVALGIASVLVVSVVQKQREIGILRAMGASAQRIMWVFLIQGAIVGAVGAVLGSSVAATLVFIASKALRQEDGSPLLETEAGLWIYLTAGLISLAVGILAAAAPARRAAKMDPVEAIRYG